MFWYPSQTLFITGLTCILLETIYLMLLQSDIEHEDVSLPFCILCLIWLFWFSSLLIGTEVANVKLNRAIIFTTKHHAFSQQEKLIEMARI